MSLKQIFVAAVAVLTVSALNAAEPTAHRIDQLQAAKEKVARAAKQTKGGPQHLLLQERARLDQLIENLEKGRSVDPAEIDRALQRAEQGGL